MINRTNVFLIFLLFFQLIFSFYFPSVGSNDSWLPISDYLPKVSLESQDTFFLNGARLLISSEYRINSDVGDYIELAKNFSPDFFENSPYLNRPLYPFLISIIAILFGPLVPASYSVIFGSAILANFLLISVTALLFFNLIKKFFAFKIALLSAILLIFSPFVHSFLPQAMPEMLTAFTVMLSIYLLHNYAIKPSAKKLAIFSIILGVLLLGKMFIALPLFVLGLAVYHRRLKEGLAFAILCPIPIGLWYLWVTNVWQMPYYVHEVRHWQMGIWVKNIYIWPWHQTLRVLIEALPNFISSVLHSFIVIPAIFFLFGISKLEEKIKRVFTIGFAISIFFMVFLINLYLYRHTFMLFPIIYPAAVLGIERAANFFKKYDPWYPQIFLALMMALIIIISNLNIYKLFYYLN